MPRRGVHSRTCASQRMCRPRKRPRCREVGMRVVLVAGFDQRPRGSVLRGTRTGPEIFDSDANKRAAALHDARSLIRSSSRLNLSAGIFSGSSNQSVSWVDLHRGQPGSRDLGAEHVVVLSLWIPIAFWPAGIAARKGHSFLGCFLFSSVFPAAPSWRTRPRFERSRLWPELPSPEKPTPTIETGGMRCSDDGQWPKLQQ